MAKYSQLVQKALSLHKRGSLQEAKLVYVQALEENPKDAQALQLLGLILFLEKEHESAIQLIQNSILNDPTIYEAHNNLGHIYQSLKEYDMAYQYYSNAIDLQPKRALAHNNIGTIYKYKNKYDLALKHYKLAIEYEPDNDEPYMNLANLYAKMGDLSSTEEVYKRILTLPSFQEKVYLNLAKTQQTLDKLKESLQNYKRYEIDDFDYLEAQSILAIYSWIKGNYKECKSYLSVMTSEKFDLDNSQDSFILSYKTMLIKLLQYKEKNSDLYTNDSELPVFYVIGDSHCLSYSNLRLEYKGKIYRVESKIVVGCKAWHLAQENNQYIEQFKNIISNIEENSNVLVIFGEIDCRLNDGILKHYKKHPFDLNITVPKFVENYINNVLGITQVKSIHPIFSLVPAPLFIKNEDEKDKTRLKEVISLFNRSLKSNLHESRQYDTFSITSNNLGERNSHLNLDNCHLLPEALMKL